MISPPPTGSRRTRYSRSPSGGGVPPSKRSKPYNSSDPYDRDHGSKSDQPRLYTSICVKNINPKITDLEIRDLCDNKFSKYGSNSVKIYHRNQERVAFVNFTNCEDARKARHAKTGLIWENMQVLLEPVYYRKTVPAEQPIRPGSSSRERSPPPRRQRRPTPPSPSPPPVRSRSNHHSSSRHQRTSSPPRSSRPPRRPYSPYIPLPPDLIDYAGKSSSRQRQRSSPSPVRRHHHKQQRNRSPNNHRSASPSLPVPPRANLNNESNPQQEPTRTLIVGNLERDITESKLKEVFGRYGTIEEIDLKKSSSKRLSASIQYENLDMAYEARRAMDGQSIGKSECKIGYGKIVPTKCLWVGNISIDMKRRHLEYAFARYGRIKSFDYSTGDPTAIVTYIDIEDAIKARSKLMGTIQLIHGRIIRNKSDTASHRAGFRIDYLDRPTSRRFVIVRPQQKPSDRRASRSSSSSSSDSPSRHHSSVLSPQNRTRTPSANINNDAQPENKPTEDVKTETQSRSPTPPIMNTIKQRRSTDRSETPSLNGVSSPIAGRTFYAPLGSYLSSEDTANINNINELMILCEQLNALATKSNTALATVYPVQFILKSQAYDARMHFLAGSSTLASLLLGQPGDLVAAKTELKITQRLRLDQHKLEDLERTLRTNVTNALAITGNNSQTNSNGHLSNGLTSTSTRKQLAVSNQTRFALLIASPKIHTVSESSDSTKQQTVTKKVKHEISSPHSGNGNNEHLEVKKEKMVDDEEEPLLSRLISYLIEKEAAGVISIPFHPTYQNDQSPRQETAVLHIFPSCQFTKKILKQICPSIDFSNTSQPPPSTKMNDEHLMVVIVHSD